MEFKPLESLGVEDAFDLVKAVVKEISTWRVAGLELEPETVEGSLYRRDGLYKFEVSFKVFDEDVSVAEVWVEVHLEPYIVFVEVKTCKIYSVFRGAVTVDNPENLNYVCKDICILYKKKGWCMADLINNRFSNKLRKVIEDWLREYMRRHAAENL